MSTHSYIGVIEEDGTLKYVYCHHTHRDRLGAINILTA